MKQIAVTSSLSSRIASRTVPENQVIAWWLGGSGFVFKSPAGTQVYIDPYLSNAVSQTFGMGRAFPPPIQAEDARPSIVISTHWHEDHLDPEAIPLIARHSPSTLFVMPPSAFSRAWYWGVPRERITLVQAGQTIQIEDIKIHHTPARHDAGLPGWEAPDAMGVILEIGAVKIYHSGDTEYDARLRALKEHKLDMAVACINGVTGNMNAHEAALLLWQLDARLVMPMHHLLWDTNSFGDLATLDPQLFADTYRKLGGTGRVVLPEVGAEIEIRR